MIIAPSYGSGRQALPTAVSLARICISFHPLGIACWLLSSASSGLALSLQLLSPFPLPPSLSLLLSLSLSTFFIHGVFHKIVRSISIECGFLDEFSNKTILENLINCSYNFLIFNIKHSNNVLDSCIKILIKSI